MLSYSPPALSISNQNTSGYPASTASLSEVLATSLSKLGICNVFGVTGGAISPLWNTLGKSDLELLHFRHEAGAAFAATEAYLATGRPAAVAVTSGPGITNALTGLYAARSEGAKVLFISGCTPSNLRGRAAMQETSPDTLGSDIFNSGALFTFARVVDSENDLRDSLTAIAAGLSGHGGYVAHLSLPVSMQNAAMPTDIADDIAIGPATGPREPDAVIASCADIVRTERIVIWVGFGARGCAESVRRLADLIGAPVMSSPRGKGIYPENHPNFIGVTGFGGHRSVASFLADYRPERLLVLGSRLGEMTSFWRDELVPPRGIIHIDIDDAVRCAAYPNAPTVFVHNEVGDFLDRLLEELTEDVTGNDTALPAPQAVGGSTPQALDDIEIADLGPVRPTALLKAVQDVIIDQHSPIVLAEAGNAFAWATHYLRFSEPLQFRISTAFASMGHAAAGVVGSALATGRKAVAIVGDGAMLMNNELSTAVHYRIPAVWIILNDSQYGMIDHGMRLVGHHPTQVGLPSADFAAYANSLGALGLRVDNELDIEHALSKAMRHDGPAVVDVVIDPAVTAPIQGRATSVVGQSRA